MTAFPIRASAAAQQTAAIWVIGVVCVQIACQLALLSQTLAPFRVLFRSAAFSISLLAIVAVSGRANRHPARFAAMAILAIVGFGFVHPQTASALAAIAQLVLYTAIIGPIFWVPRLAVNRQTLVRLFTVFWSFHVLSSIFGVLQIYYPGQFQPNISDNVITQGELSKGLQITLANGESVWRPMGLTDSPGGAGMAGLYAFVFGMGFLAIGERWTMRIAGMGGMVVGLFCIYLSQIRSIFLLTIIIAITFAAILAALRRYSAVSRLGIAVPVIGVAVFLWASAVGGAGMVKRLETLIEADPGQVYYSNRGVFLEDTFTSFLPENPLGCGLGRWGMTANYFGNANDPTAPGIWVEIQWTAWVADGGLLLLVAYPFAILMAMITVGRIAIRSREPWLSGWAILILAYDTAAVALTFNYPLFIGQFGLEFWLLNGAIYAAKRTTGSK